MMSDLPLSNQAMIVSELDIVCALSGTHEGSLTTND